MFLKNYKQTFLANLLAGFTIIILPLLFSQLWNKEQFGLFCYLLVIISLIQVFIDYGFSLQTVKAVSDNPSNYLAIFYTQLTAKNLITLCTLILSVCYLFIFKKNENSIVILLLLLSAIAYSYGQFLIFPLQGLKDFSTANKMTIYSNFTYLLFATPIFILPITKLVWVSLLIALGRIGGLVVNLVIARKLFGTISIQHFKLNRKTLITLREGLPFALVFFFGLAYFQADSFFVKHYLGYDAIATYQIGIRLIMMVAFVTAIFNIVALPYLNPLRSNTAYFYEIKQASIDLLTFYGGFVAIFFVVFAKQIAAMFGHHFFDLTNYLPIFGLIILIRNFGNGYSLLLTIIDLQSFRTIALCVACCISVIASLYLVPTFQIWGALGSACITLLVINCLYIGFVWLKINKIFLSTSVISIFLYYLLTISFFYQFPHLFSQFGLALLVVYVILFFQKNAIGKIFALL